MVPDTPDVLAVVEGEHGLDDGDGGGLRAAETKRTSAGSRASTVIRGAYFLLSTKVPIQILAGQTPP